MAAKRFSNMHAPGTAPWPPDAYYDPCSTGHSTDTYHDDHGKLCCRRCGDALLRAG